MMDPEIRDSLHAEGYGTEQAFFDAYCQRHREKHGGDFEWAKPHPQV